jgi:putative acetyltransferase
MPDVRPHDLTLRAERPADHDAIDQVVRAAFRRVGGAGASESSGEVAMVEHIRASDRYVPELALVAVIDDEVVGHAMLSEFDLVRDDGRGIERVLELAPVAVRPDYHGFGIGSALCRELLRLAHGRGEPLVLVLGHPTYYPRFGFELAVDHGIRPPDPAMAPAFFVAPLRDDREGLQGRVEFPF